MRAQLTFLTTLTNWLEVKLYRNPYIGRCEVVYAQNYLRVVTRQSGESMGEMVGRELPPLEDVDEERGLR